MPWNRGSEDPDADSDILEDVAEETEATGTMGGQEPKVVIVTTKEAKPRGLYMTARDVIDHGFTRRCGGCSSIQRGIGRQPHNDKCRERFANILKNEAKTKNADKRKQDVIKAASTEPEEKRQRDEVSSSSGGSGEIVGNDSGRMNPDRSTVERSPDLGTFPMGGASIMRPPAPLLGLQQELEEKELKRAREDEEQIDVNSLLWWDFGEKVDEDGDERAIQQVELDEHMADVQERVGGGDMGRWVADVKSDMDQREYDEKDKFNEALEDYEWAWDDVHGGEIRLSDLRTAGKEEVDFMIGRHS